MKKVIKSLKGTHDILPKEVGIWQEVEDRFHDICSRFAYKEIRIPAIEYTELFQRGVGDTSDVVNKEMYSFLDRGGRNISLRPEGTAGVVRSFIENGLSSEAFPVKLYYLITAYRAENVQAGRYREFRQFGVEAFGSEDPGIDVEMISMLDMYFKDLGLTNAKLKINSIGDKESRLAYKEKLIEYYKPLEHKLCPICKDRLYKNPMRLLDCKEKDCKILAKNAPKILDYLNDDSKKHFDEVLSSLDDLGIEYEVDPMIVRGLDYYSKTVFEFVLDDSTAAQAGTICGGGRYDGLVASLGGQDCSGIGFSIGGERLIKALCDIGKAPERDNRVDLYLASQSDEFKDYVRKMAYELRRAGLKVEVDLCGRSFKAQMKYANKSEARYLIVVGQEELNSKVLKVRDMRNREIADVEVELETDKIISVLAGVNRCR